MNVGDVRAAIHRCFIFAAALLAGMGATATVRAAEAGDEPFAALASEYEAMARPLVNQFCLDCHSTAAQEGELDLERFATLADVRKGTDVWQRVVEMIDNGEMPPEDAQPQPTAEQRQQLRDWARRYLDAEARANAGDPGPVVLRRLNNAQYTYTIRDLTGVELDPASEFPVDGAAGEGFTNTGNSLVMSPSLLTKYLDAGKEIANHVVLLPDGFRFSPSTNRPDWTNETLTKIREFYAEFTGAGTGGTHVNLQGIQFETNSGGRLPVEAYLAATLAEREPLRTGDKSIAEVAKERGLNAKYLGILWNALNGERPSLLLDAVREKWTAADADGAAALAGEIRRWQDSLFRFSSVGHIGKVGGPTAWQEPLTPLASRQDVRLKLPEIAGQEEVVFYLFAGDAGDGNEHDVAVWERPRIVAPGRPDLLLRDVRPFAREMTARRERLFASTAKALAAAAEASRAQGDIDMPALAKSHDVDLESLAAWLTYLGIGTSATLDLDHFTNQLTSAGNYDFVQGWGSPETPSVIANSSDQHVRIPGNMKPHGVIVHPSPELYAAVGWQSPVAGTLRVEGQVTHAHPECGNGVTWSLELRRGASRQQLAAGISHGSTPVMVGPIESLVVQPGDLVSLRIGPRDANHACDSTDVELVLESREDEPRQWSLTRDVSGDVLAANPHADRFGNEGVWHFYSEPVKDGERGSVIPAGSLLARWQSAEQADQQQDLAEAIQALLISGPPADAAEDHPDVLLYHQLASFRGLLSYSDGQEAGQEAGQGEGAPQPQSESAADAGPSAGLDPALFGRHPNGSAIDPGSLGVQAPSVLEVRLPAELAAGAEFVTAGVLHPDSGGEGSVQFQVLQAPPESTTGLLPSAVAESKSGTWTSAESQISYATPIIALAGSPAQKRFEQLFQDFRDLFPAALCYMEIVPVDEVVTLTLYYREDEPLRRLMLNDQQMNELDRLWEELHFVSHDAITLVDAFEQLLEYASQDGDPSVFEPLRTPIEARAAAFRQSLVDAEPKQIEALVEFAERAYRRPLADDEADDLRQLYRGLRNEGLPHDEAFRFTLARIFVAPAFLYRLEEAPPGTDSGPVSDWELASRLSYFLWSSPPDDELRDVAASGKLHEPEVLAGQARRMLASPRVRRLATEFACQWLQIYNFDSLDEKSPEAFPEFEELRDDMYEESIRFFADLFQRDASVLEIFDADHTFLNERLASFYGIPLDAEDGPGVDADTTDDWQRVDGIGQHARGGILGLAAALAKHSGASRSSPILRGIWISEAVLGEKLPNPPPGVPPFPEQGDAVEKLTVRQLTELHTSNPDCAGCHMKVDPFGFALESFDAIGRFRTADSAGRPLDTQARLPDGAEVSGAAELREYLVNERRDALLRQFCRKLLGYSLGRGIQLSDEPLLAEMQQQLEENDYRFSAAVETILQSRQFREIRGRDTDAVESP